MDRSLNIIIPTGFHPVLFILKSYRTSGRGRHLSTGLPPGVIHVEVLPDFLIGWMLHFTGLQQVLFILKSYRTSGRVGCFISSVSPGVIYIEFYRSLERRCLRPFYRVSPGAIHDKVLRGILYE